MTAKIEAPWINLMTSAYSEEDFLVQEEELNMWGIKGEWRLQELNGCSIFETQLKQEKNSKLGLNISSEMVKLHFQLVGTQVSLGKDGNSKQFLGEGYFNFLKVEKGKRSYRLRSTIIHSFELHFKKEFLLSVIGNLNSKLIGFLKDDKDDDCLPFWQHNQPLTNYLCELINNIKTCSLQGALRKSYLEAKVIELVEALFVKKPKCISLGIVPARPPKIEDALMEKVHIFLQRNMSKSITIPQLAQFAGVNTSKLKHDFKQAYGTTLFKHLTSLRMERAYQMLSQKDTTIAHISQKVGYKNPQHFTAAFKKYYGFLPREIN
ncbi:helix-turn-helix transcriptional regulator [Euzebyella saccharophila]|uniref:Helix-turn-helix transcriptional regulator n=1 Tax=Euzebyella saccharophila TaxID=679664 RepID=A0ABV8JJC4_9FLAO|nr:AraC family transcriptional regulator [Euzebyella saccharophila]